MINFIFLLFLALPLCAATPPAKSPVEVRMDTLELRLKRQDSLLHVESRQLDSLAMIKDFREKSLEDANKSFQRTLAFFAAILTICSIAAAWIGISTTARMRRLDDKLKDFDKKQLEQEHTDKLAAARISEYNAKISALETKIVELNETARKASEAAEKTELSRIAAEKTAKSLSDLSEKTEADLSIAANRISDLSRLKSEAESEKDELKRLIAEAKQWTDKLPVIEETMSAHGRSIEELAKKVSLQGTSKKLSADDKATVEFVAQESIKRREAGKGINSWEAYIEGHMHRIANRLDDALIALNHAIALNPDFANAYTERGIVLGMKGEYENALDEFQKAIDHGEELATSYNNISYTLSKLNRIEEAWQYLEKALNLGNRHAEVYETRALLYVLGNKPEHAIQDIAQSISLDDTRREHIRKDEDFASLRINEEFKRLVRE